MFIPDAPENANDAGLASIGVGAKDSTGVWAARLGRVIASEQHAFGRLEVDVAPQLVPLPRKAQLVFVIDSSFSVKAPMIDAHLAIIRTFVAHVPDAEIEIITYRRDAKRVFGKFVPARELPAAIEAARKTGAFAFGNGSALDAATKLAAAVLADRKGPRRIILTTDHLVRPDLDPAQLLATLAKLPKDIVVHAIAPETDDDERVQMTRNDADLFAALATKHHGIFVTLTGLPTAVEKILPTEKLLLPVVLELVRPTRIEKLKTTGGFTLASDVLREGEGIRLFAKAKTAPQRVTLTGVMWSDPVRKDVSVGEAFSRSAAAFVFGEDEYHDLSDAEQLKVAFMGRAVSPVTSYVAAEPGTRPSTVGIGHGRGTGTGYGAGGGRGGMKGRTRAKFDFASLIDTRACVAQFKPAPGWEVWLHVDTTYDEIVDVQITNGAGPLATCLAETTWRIRLDAARFDLSRDEFGAVLK